VIPDSLRRNFDESDHLAPARHREEGEPQRDGQATDHRTAPELTERRSGGYAGGTDPCRRRLVNQAVKTAYSEIDYRPVAQSSGGVDEWRGAAWLCAGQRRDMQPAGCMVVGWRRLALQRGYAVVAGSERVGGERGVGGSVSRLGGVVLWVVVVARRVAGGVVV
jgi:hypothetical protein